MNSIKSIILLELLYKQSSINKDEILKMFMNVVDETDIYKRLENLLNSNIFIGVEATDLLQRANALLNEVLVNPQEAINIFFKLEELVITIEKKKHESEFALMDLDFYGQKPTVVSKTHSATSTKFYEEFYKALTYFTVILFGVDGIKKWSAFPMGSFTDLVNFIDTVLIEKIKEVKATKRKWSIVSKYYSGGNSGVAYVGCELAFEDTNEISKIGPHKHPYLRIGNPDDRKLVEGYGYITGVCISDVNSLFDGELINEVNISNVQIDPLVIDSNMIYNPVEFISKVLGTNKFVLSPDAYVKLLNKYFLNRTIVERKNGSKCLLCGRGVDASVSDICSRHFDYTQN